MEVAITLEGYQAEILRRVAERIGCDDYEEVFGRSLCLADVVSWHWSEEGARIEMIAPSLSKPSTLEPGPLYGEPGIPHPRKADEGDIEWLPLNAGDAP